MKRIEKLIRATPDRRTRFHTLRGTSISAREWLDVPRRVVQRVLGRELNEPWLPSAAVRELDRILSPERTVLEFGSGASTGWIARRAARVESVEPDPVWYARISADLARAGLDNATVIYVPTSELVEAMQRAPDGAYDLVLVDTGDDSDPDRGRVGLVREGRHKVRPGGYLVLDNSDRPAYEEVDALMTGWSVKRLAGMPAKPLTVGETTFFRRAS